jgi:putative nucleotidyltransferase with HDIG domain
MTHAPDFKALMSLVPVQGEINATLDWAAPRAFWPEIAALDKCPQDSWHHAEGDVGTHTRMVVAALVNDPAWHRLPIRRASALFWAAILHDIGKPATTRHEDGRITSRGHSSEGARIARRLLWEAGAPIDWREEICGLIGAHQAPFWMIEREDPERLAAEISLRCNTADLCLLARADATGRIAADQAGLMDNIALAAETFSEAACLGRPYPFPNDSARVENLRKPHRPLSHAPFEDHRCTATILCGLPGAGKDTWIADHRKSRGLVSLDDLRLEMGAKPHETPGQVVQAARECARQYLRDETDFIWNATNLNRMRRRALVDLCLDYGARVSIVYLETDAATLFSRNRTRPDGLPVKTLRAMIPRVEAPDLSEAHDVMLSGLKSRASLEVLPDQPGAAEPHLY